MSELDELAAAARGDVRGGYEQPPAVEYQPQAPSARPRSRWRPVEIFQVGFFGGLGFMSSVLVFWIAVSVLFFLLSFVGCALISGATSRAPQPARTPPAFPFGQ